MRFCFLLILLSQGVLAVDYGYLKPEDQKFFKNDSNEGKNQFERIDANVKEINRLHSDVATLKMEVIELRKEIQELKKK